MIFSKDKKPTKELVRIWMRHHMALGGAMIVQTFAEPSYPPTGRIQVKGLLADGRDWEMNLKYCDYEFGDTIDNLTWPMPETSIRPCEFCSHWPHPDSYALSKPIKRFEVFPETLTSVRIEERPETGLFVAALDHIMAMRDLEHRLRPAVAAPIPEAGAKRILRRIIDDLPSRRDWLDPDLERAAKELLATPPLPEGPAPDALESMNSILTGDYNGGDVEDHAIILANALKNVVGSRASQNKQGEQQP